MNSHIADELPLLLTGDASQDVVLAAAAHLRTCADCQQELVSAVVAHASLTSAQRFAREVLAPVQPQPRPRPLPDLGPVLAQVREEAETGRVHIAAPRRRRTLIAVAAAAAAVVVGGGVTVAELSGGSSTPTTTVGLAAFGEGHAPAKAVLVGKTTLTLDAQQLPKPAAGQRYEVWFTDAAREQKRAVGFIGDNNTASFTVSPAALSQFGFIEVSVQGLTQDTFSGRSVLRGALR